VVSELLNRSTGQGRHVHVGVAVLPGGEGQPLPIGRNAGVAFGTVEGGDPVGCSAVGWHCPQITVISEDQGLAVGRQGRMVSEVELLGAAAGAKPVFDEASLFRDEW